MNALIVYAHPESTSFTGAMTDAAARALGAAGHRVTVSDLYAERFDPVAGRHDFASVADASRFHYQAEQLHAAERGAFAPDLAREQARVAEADLLLLVFPLWWGGIPAIMKGWIDRVLAYGFAYADGKRYEHGYFLGRRALIGVTTGGPAARFVPGAYGEIDQVLHPLRRCVLEYLGLEVLPTFAAYASPRVDVAARAEYLEQWQRAALDAISDPAWQARQNERPALPHARASADLPRAWTAQR